MNKDFHVVYSKDQVDALRMESSPVSPEIEQSYRRLEDYSIRTFLRLFGDFLTEQQRESMGKTRVIITGEEHVRGLGEMFSVPVNINLERSSLNGVIYYGYDIRQEYRDRFPDYVLLSGFWVPGLSFFSIRDSELSHPVGVSYLRRDECVEQFIDNNPQLSSTGKRHASERIREISSLSIRFAGTVLHEINHSIQDTTGIPLPLLEAQCYWIQDRVLREMGVSKSYSSSLWEFKFILAFEQLLEKFGDDLNSLIWGNCQEIDCESLVYEVKSMMDDDFVNNMLPNWLEWKTRRVRDI